VKSNEMAELFELDIENNTDGSSDYSSTAADEISQQSFDDKCQDVKAITDNEDAIISAALETPSNTEDFADDVEKDMQEFASEDKIEPVQESLVESPDKEDNPLGLAGSELSAYYEIEKKYPQFVLYDGTPSFREFYRYKVRTLTSLCSRFPVLDTRAISHEVGNVKTDHYIGESYISPDILRQKLDECYQAKTRLSAILIGILEQYPAWERFCDMLKSKLWKDHELKGTHRRDGLTLEHMSDLEEYVSCLKGVLDAAKYADNLLKAATESLSRQLSCLQIKHVVGISTEAEVSKPQTRLDTYDSISSGEVISAPERTGQPSEVNFGVDPDDLAKLGG